MQKMLACATAALFALSVGGALTATHAFAQPDKDRAALMECKRLADPGARDECVKNVEARTRGEAGKAKAEKARTEAETKAGAAAKKGEGAGRPDQTRK